MKKNEENNYSGIWVFTEVKDGKPAETSCEILSEGRKLADQLKEALVAVVMGWELTGVADGLFPYGPDRILMVDHAFLAGYAPEAYTAIMSGLVIDRKPSILLMGATTVGNDLAPRVAARVRTGLTTNCDKLQLSSNRLLVQTRLCYERKVHVRMSCPTARPQMATIEPGVMKTKKMPRSRVAEKVDVVQINPVTFWDPELDCLESKGLIKADPKTIDISDAEIIIAGGKGAGDLHGFQCIRNLAEKLQASVAGSRVAVDNGAIGRERQIGQSGKMVSPDLLISCGISGANAHTVGMRDAKTVVALNTDKNAPIFKLADLGVVGDLHEIIPFLIDQIDKHQMRNGN